MAERSGGVGYQSKTNYMNVAGEAVGKASLTFAAKPSLEGVGTTGSGGKWKGRAIGLRVKAPILWANVEGGKKLEKLGSKREDESAGVWRAFKGGGDQIFRLYKREITSQKRGAQARVRGKYPRAAGIGGSHCVCGGGELEGRGKIGHVSW